MKKLLILSFILLASCGEGDIVGPVSGPFPSPSPIPSPSASPVIDDACRHTGTQINGDAHVAGLGFNQIYEINLIPLHNSTPLDPNCPGYPRVAGWNAFGPCVEIGQLNDLRYQYYCLFPGVLNLTITNGPFTLPFRVTVTE